MTTRIENKVAGKFRADRFRQVMKQILLDRSQWDQGSWHCIQFSGDGDDAEDTGKFFGIDDDMVGYCKTAHCFAGWCDVISGRPQEIFALLKDKNVDIDLNTNRGRNMFMDMLTSGDESLEIEEIEIMAENWLGLERGDDLFASDNSLKDLANFFYDTMLDQSNMAMNAARNTGELIEIQSYHANLMAEKVWCNEVVADALDELPVNPQDVEAEVLIFSPDGPRLDVPHNKYEYNTLHFFSEIPEEVVQDFANGNIESDVCRAARAYLSIKPA